MTNVIREAVQRAAISWTHPLDWADDPSLLWLIYLSGRVSEAPIGVLVAARSGRRA